MGGKRGDLGEINALIAGGVCVHGFSLPQLLTLRFEEALSLNWRCLGVGFWRSFYAWLKLKNQKKKPCLWPSGQRPRFTSFVVNFNGPPAIFV